MDQAQILLYGLDDKRADRLRQLAQARGLWLREVRQATACLHLLQRGGLLVLRLGKDLERELSLLERASHLFPHLATVVIGDDDNPLVNGLAWDLGARFVVLNATPADLLCDVVRAQLPAADAAILKSDFS